MTTLPPELTLRPAAWTDVEAVAQLTLDVCTAEGDPSMATAPSTSTIGGRPPVLSLKKMPGW